MKLTINEIVQALRCHADCQKTCDPCVFVELMETDENCTTVLCTAAADLIEEYVDRCARFSEEIMELREQRRNDPLTPDELKEMHGEPVWVVWLDGRLRSRWHIVGSSLWIEMFIEWGGAFSPDYGKTWLAYRHKTEEVNNGKDS